ncbi:MAG: UvrD-helicase domain-containing protein [Fimbriimonadales bacterium]
MRWTDEQLEAIRHRIGRLAVTAGAGSGKTGVLTERFVHLVHAHGVNPESILTITFTRAATAEMKVRIIQKLERLGLHDARQRIESAYIHTVHALCRRLLQENPFEAGIEPEPSVLPAPAARQLSREAFHLALESQLQSLAGEEKDALTGLIGAHLSLTPGRQDPLEALYQAVKHLTDTARHQGLTLEEMHAWAARFPQNPFEPLVAFLQRQISHMQSPPPVESLEAIHRWLENAQRSASSAETQSRIASLLSLVGRVEERKEFQVHRMAHALLRLSCAYLEHYEQLKERTGVLDFDDMQIRALKLLRESATVRHRYQRLFRYVLVDETQDIDPLQAQIIDLLSQGGNLMVVGDVQQSIYGFRHADPSVFQRWQHQARSDPNGKLVLLQANFRSHPDILAFVEKVLQPKWKDGFVRLTPMRSVQASLSQTPRVQVWYRKNRDSSSEAQQVAATIREWVERQSLPVHDPETGEVRPAEYRDFALLFRQFTHVQDYETQFQAMGVPYFVVGGGRGYWLQYEVRDMANLMRILSDSQDEVALLSVLRSPLVGLSLDGLMSLVLESQTRDEPLLSVVLNAPEISLDPDDAENLARFVGWFVPLMQAVGRESVGWIMARALEYSAYEAKLLGLPRGRQMVANVRKLLALALEQPTLTPAQFAEQLDMMHRTEQQEGHAPTYEETANVVRFYTVHGAKGLEFPVVFLVDTAYRPRQRDSAVLTEPRERLLGMRLRVPDSAQPYESLLYTLLLEERKKQEEAEELRALYVALTRARDYLIVCLSHSQSNEWSRALAGALAETLNKRQTRFTLPNGGWGQMVYCEE